MREMVSVDEAARLVRVHADTIRRLISRGELKAQKLLGRWRISVADLEATVGSLAARESAGNPK